MSGVRQLEVSIFDCACGKTFEGTKHKVDALRRMHFKICDIGRNVPTIGDGEIQKPRLKKHANIVSEMRKDLNEWGYKLGVNSVKK